MIGNNRELSKASLVVYIFVTILKSGKLAAAVLVHFTDTLEWQVFLIMSSYDETIL